MRKQYLNSIKDRILKAKRILITGHAGPDFDSAGSCLGLYEILKDLGKEVTIGTFFRERIWERLLAGEPAPTGFKSSHNPDLVILLDYGKMHHLPSYIRGYIEAHDPCVITIDNHSYQDQQGDVVWIDQDGMATAEMIYDLASQNRWLISDIAAFYLLTGIIAESGALGFYPVKLKALGKLMKLIRSDSDLMRATYIIRGWENIDDIRTFGLLLRSIKADKGLGLAWGVWKEAHPRGSELIVRAIHELMFIQRYRVMFFLRAVAGSSEWYCSLRGSKDNRIDLNLLAGRFGGGGHFNSAGFKSQASSATIIKQLKQLIKQAQKNNNCLA